MTSGGTAFLRSEQGLYPAPERSSFVAIAPTPGRTTFVNPSRAYSDASVDPGDEGTEFAATPRRLGAAATSFAAANTGLSKPTTTFADATTLKAPTTEIEQAAAIIRRGDTGLARLIGINPGTAAGSSPVVEALVAFVSAVNQPVYARTTGPDGKPTTRETSARKRGLPGLDLLLTTFGGPAQLYRNLTVDAGLVAAAIGRMPAATQADATRTWQRAQEVSEMRDFGRREVYVRRDGPEARSR